MRTFRTRASFGAAACLGAGLSGGAGVGAGADDERAIVRTLNAETAAFFRRDYDAWARQWVHAPSVSKTYMNFADATFSETVGWRAIDRFGRAYIAEHPAPDPLPALLDRVTVRVYGTGAWVTFQQRDPLRGLKRETRLMEKVGGRWRIAGMHTTIYGFARKPAT